MLTPRYNMKKCTGYTDPPLYSQLCSIYVVVQVLLICSLNSESIVFINYRINSILMVEALIENR
jgi:hypothetical protein